MIEVRSPYDNSLVGTVKTVDWNGADKLLNDAHALYLNRGAWPGKYKRIEILRNFSALLSRDSKAMAETASKEGGKPLTDSLVEVKRAINGVEVAISELYNLRGTGIPMGMTEASKGHMAFTVQEPCGVVLAISAFNHPVNLIIHQVVPAIAAGCPVIVKPASATPLSCLKIVDLLYEAGLPKEWCKAVVCSSDVASKMCSDQRLGFITFIGSSKVGWHIRKNLAPGVRCSLEHGGAASAILEPDADIDSALPGLVKAGYYHAGQVCVSLQRLYVHKSIVDNVCEKTTAMVKALKTGDPLDMKTEVGPLINASEVERVDSWIKEAIKAGAELLAGGKRIPGTCYAPTLLLNPPASAKVSCEEVFGPLVSIYEYDKLDDALIAANSLPYEFQSSVYTRNIDTALYAASRIKAKSIMINEHTAFRVDWMPFGGAGMSGMGAGGIGYSMRDMCGEKLLVIKSGAV